MTTTKHTPGPWNTAPSTTGGGTARLDVVSDGTEFSPSFVAGDILPEDARLIAAAPDLLAALQSFLAEFQDFERWPQGKSYCMSNASLAVFKQSRAAIKQATGE